MIGGEGAPGSVRFKASDPAPVIECSPDVTDAYHQ
jgi:hypothetical protein